LHIIVGVHMQTGTVNSVTLSRHCIL
jgi:hypothetical protein